MSFLLSIKLADTDPWVTVTPAQAAEAKKARNAAATKMVRNSYTHETRTLTSPEGRALGIQGGGGHRPRPLGDRHAQASPSRESNGSNDNPFNGLNGNERRRN